VGDQEPFAGLDSDTHEPEPEGAHSAVDFGEPHADSTTPGEQWEVQRAQLIDLILILVRVLFPAK
jgi:hypothetical protein